MFVNRVSELDLLEKRYASGKAEFFVLYGRRRVGRPGYWRVSAKVNVQIFSYQTWVRKYL
jgi:AAA+ ATPase superfamily predicted ATPase